MSRRLILAAWLVALAPAAAHAASPEQLRLTPADIAQLHRNAGGPGTSGVTGIETVILSGDPTAAGPYAIELKVPAHTVIAAHTHRDDRTAVVVSGVWNFGYGKVADAAAAKALEPGSFYSEPAGAAHFAMTGATPVTVIISGFGPTDTDYVAKRDPAPANPKEDRP